MTSYETIKLSIAESGLATLTLNRPQQLNALTEVMLQELDHAVQTLNENVDVRATILTGEGRAFCAGRDKNEVGEARARDRHMLVPKLEPYHSTMIRLLEMPVIAAINGAAVGVALGFVMQCDVRIASSNAFFLDGHLQNNMIPSVATWYLPRVMGPEKALQFFCDTKRMDAATALSCGMVSEVVEPGELLPRAQALAEIYLRWNSELVRHTKWLVRAAGERRFEDLMTEMRVLRGVQARANRP